jgi:hypothetical protein
MHENDFFLEWRLHVCVKQHANMVLERHVVWEKSEENTISSASHRGFWSPPHSMDAWCLKEKGLFFE